jgi:hypothetical protein
MISLTNRSLRVSRPAGSVGTIVAVVGLVLFVRGCAVQPAAPVGDAQAFAVPSDAVDALITAIRTDDLDRLRAIMGEEARDILSSGDEVADRAKRQQFLALYDEHHQLIVGRPGGGGGDDTRTLIVGNADWPFPIPLVRDAGQWVFDAAAGHDEIINRRVGENELTTIQVCKAIADAQREYALTDPDGSGVRQYARKIMSDEGRRNGLYWRTAPGEPQSPLGELVAEASAEGYVRKEVGPTPYHGYYYRILEAQGPKAPGGAVDYVVDGKMTLGFAVLAYPADYGSSGVMTFLAGADGVVYQASLGENTTELAQQMKAFDPDERWKTVE